MTIAAKKPGRRHYTEELVARRKEDILAAATRIFARNGFRNTDVQEIADALEVGKGTVYRYFPSKRDLFLGAVDRGMRRFLKCIEREAEKSATKLERVARVVHAYLAFFDSNPETVELLIQERAEFPDRERPTFFAYCDSQKETRSRTFRWLVEQGMARDITPDTMFDIISNLLYGAMFTNFFSGRTQSCEDQARDIVNVFFNGILRNAYDGEELGPLMARISREFWEAPSA